MTVKANPQLEKAVVKQHANPRSAANLFEELLTGISEDELRVLEERSLTSGKASTLKQLAETLEVTHEWIRQIELGAKGKWRGLVRDPRYRPIRDLADRISDEIGSAVPVSDESFSQVADRFLGGLASQPRAVAFGLLLERKGYSRRDDWLVRLSPREQKSLIAEVKELTRTWHVVPRAELARLLGEYGIAENHVEAWCTDFVRLRFIDMGALPKGSSRDDIARVLLHRGQPATVDRLLAEAELSHRNAQGIRNQMSQDPRFTRIDRDTQFAHRDWGFDAYTGIADGIIDELKRCGGTAPLDRLCGVLSQRYGVAESSVRAFAAAPIFMKTASGEVTLRPESVPFEFDDDPGTSPLCFWHGDHWALRMPVTENSLRGSGRNIPVQFAAYLGCRPGVNKVFASASGDVRAVWPVTSLGPSLGSVRPALVDTAAEEGDLLFVCYRPGASDIDLRVVRQSAPGSTPVHQRIAGELGLHEGLVSLSDVAYALRVEHDGVLEPIVWRGVQTALQTRSALDISGLLGECFPELAEQSAAVDALDDSGE